MKSEINLLIGLVLIVVTGLLVFGCRTKDHETNAALTIHIDERNIILDKVTYSDLVRVVEVIPLETNNESIFAKADKVIVTDNNIYILDERRSNAVFIFTR